MDLLRSRAARTRVSEIFYIVFNALLPVAVLILVRGFDPPYLAIALVLLSKWRIFALRPRFWWTNIKANLVDVLVGLSVVGLMYLASGDLIVQIMIMLGYGVWQVVIKPRSGHYGIMAQAGIAQFLSLVVLFSLSAVFNEPFVILASGIVGYVSARHVVSNYEERYVELWATMWGMLLAELAWLLIHWTTAYNLGLPILIPQIALIMLVIGFCAGRMYHMAKTDKLDRGTLRGTVLFGAILLGVILLFSPWDVTI